MPHPTTLNESTVETAALEWLAELGYATAHGDAIQPGGVGAERESLEQVVLTGRLRAAVARFNPQLDGPAIDEVVRRIEHPEHPSLAQNNRQFHRWLVEGVPVAVRQRDGSTRHHYAQLVDFEAPLENDFLAVQQYSVREGRHKRRPDVVIFLNGLPIALLELKHPADEDATLLKAWRQLQTYKDELPSLLACNEILVISDGVQTRVGSLTGNVEWFMPWRTVDGETQAPPSELELKVLVQGLFERGRLLTYLRHFIAFGEEKPGSVSKVIAGYHQFHAVNKALRETVRAAALAGGEEPGTYWTAGDDGPRRRIGDHRVGVVWHTQGSGKSLTMTFYAGRVIQDRRMRNPTIVVLTDRNDLDDQLYGTFARYKELLRQPPEQASSRAELQRLLEREAGGVLFTTVQKFMPEEKGDTFPTLSTRANIVVIADEAHRSQYDFVDGYARHIHDALPNAAFIGFTGTPIALADKNTRAVFGDDISVYDIQQAVYDKATVPIYYESRVAKLRMRESERPHIDEEFEELTETQEAEAREKLRSKWAAIEALVGAPSRIELVAADLVAHVEARRAVLPLGKAMVVCMSRRICVALYDAIARLRPEWCCEADGEGRVKIVMTGAATDPVEWQQHIRSKEGREEMARRFKDADDPFQIVIVRDMWLTGFDAPSLSTMYIDKPMRGHGLMQAIARVNRVFKDKPGGLVVDYLGIADQLRTALATYTEAKGTGRTAIPQEEAVALVKREYEICADFFHGFDWSRWLAGTGADRLALLPGAQQYILAKPQEQQKEFARHVAALTSAFALATPHEDVLKLRDGVGFFQYVKAAAFKPTLEGTLRDETLDTAVSQLVSRAIVADEVVDIFAATGIRKPDISVLSDEFLEDVRGMPQKDLAVELLRKLLNNEIRELKRSNVVQARAFSDMLERSLQSYHNRTVETYRVIEEMIRIAREIEEKQKRGERLGLSNEEIAFYDALGANQSAVQVLGDQTLMIIARELVTTVRKNATIDWEDKEDVKAALRVYIRRILRRYGYPPDLQAKATETVLEQARNYAEEWLAAA